MANDSGKRQVRALQQRNPRNYSNELFKALTRIFSGPLVQYRRQTEKTLRGKQLNKYKNTFKSTSGQEFQRKLYNPFEYLNYHLYVNQQRAQRYFDFSQMEFNPDISSCLDVYGDELTAHSHLEPMLRIKCGNEEIKEVLNVLYYDILNLKHNLFGWARTLCKYGDFFLYLDIDEDRGVKNVIGLPTEEVERLEGLDPENPNYCTFQWNAGHMTFENWQIAHMRILGNDKYAPYGSSVLDPARRVFKQMTLLEEAMLSYRVTRSAERRVFYVDIGNIAPEDVDQYMQKIITNMKRSMIISDTSGQADERYNPLNVEEDFFIPVRGQGTGTKIENLPGGAYTGDIDDVKYIRDKLFAALKVPQSYISRGEDGGEDKESLSGKDIRFARTILRIQRAIVSELEKVGIIHLYVNGFRGEDLLSFSLSLNNPSKISEMQDLELWREKFDVAASATEGYFSRRWISEKLFNQSDEEFRRNQRELFYDRTMDAEYEKIASAGEGGEGGMGGGGGLEDTGDEDMGLEPEETSSGTESAPEPAEEEPGVLLAKPDDGAPLEESKDMLSDDGYITPGAKGKVYHPVKVDNRPEGARRRHMQGLGNKEKSSATLRNIAPGRKLEVDSVLKRLKETLLSGEKQGVNANYDEDESLLKENSISIALIQKKLQER